MNEWWQISLAFVSSAAAIVLIPALTARFTRRAEARDRRLSERKTAVVELLAALEAEARSWEKSERVELRDSRKELSDRAALALIAQLRRRERPLAVYVRRLHAPSLSPHQLDTAAIDLGAWANGSKDLKPFTTATP